MMRIFILILLLLPLALVAQTSERLPYLHTPSTTKALENPAPVLQEISVYPNPTRGIAEISIRSLKQEKQDVSVYNLLGQKVRSVQNSVLPSGETKVKWDGKDDNGHPLVSGVYFIKVNDGAQTRTSKLIVIK
jgi:hypothetical protein